MTRMLGAVYQAPDDSPVLAGRRGAGRGGVQFLAQPLASNIRRCVGVTFLRADLGTRRAANAAFLVRDRHHFLFVFLVIVVAVDIHRDSLAIFGHSHEFKHTA